MALKFSISYNRKVKAGRSYEMLEIGLYREFDDSKTPPTEAFNLVRDLVTAWVQREQDRLLESSVNRPEISQKGEA